MPEVNRADGMLARFLNAALHAMNRRKTVALAAPLGVLFLTGAALFGFSIRTVSAVSRGSRDAVRAGGGSVLSAVFMPGVQVWERDIARWSEGYGLDPNLVATVMQIESCGNPAAVSRAGAQGLFQVMPFHFAAGEDMQDPEVNARRGLAYLAESLLLAEGDIALALAGYNGGHGVIAWAESEWPSETQGYAYWGTGIYADAAAGLASSLRLEEWLDAGGRSLCGFSPG